MGKTKQGLFAAIAAVTVLTIAVTMVVKLSPGELQAQVTNDVKPSIDLSNVVVMGDSISAGYHMGVWENTPYGVAASENYPTYLASQAGISFVQSIIDQGCLIDGCTDPISSIRLNGSVQAQNLAVPGASLDDVLNTRPAVPEGLLCAVGAIPQPCDVWGVTEFVLGFPNAYAWVYAAATGALNPGDPSTWPPRYSQLEKAEQLNPSTVIVWIGNNDVLGYATQGGENNNQLTPVAEFEANYNELMDRAKALNPSAIITLNLPDVTSIPHFFTFEQTAGLLYAMSGGAVQLTPEQVAYALGLDPLSNTLITLSAFNPNPYVASAYDILLTGETGPLYSAFYLDTAEIAAVQSRTQTFNEIIEDSTAQDHSVKMIDINEFFAEVVEEGVTISSNWTATATYGDVLFDADGVHPSPFGHALIANKIIKLLNDHYEGVSIPEISLYDFAVDHGYDPAMLGHPVPPEHAKLKKVTDMLSGITE